MGDKAGPVDQITVSFALMGSVNENPQIKQTTPLQLVENTSTCILEHCSTHGMGGGAESTRGNRRGAQGVEEKPMHY